MDDAFISLNFLDRFPYFFWVSTWGSDGTYPDGFRYKMLSSRDRTTNEIEVCLLREEANGKKTEMKRWDAPAGDAVLNLLRKILRGLADEYGIEFQEQDLSCIQTEAEFEISVSGFGWNAARP